MMTATADTRELAGLIQPGKLKAHGFSVPSRVSVILGTNHIGEEAYQVFLVFPDATSDEVLAWSNVKPMVRWVQDQIWKAGGEQRWPYVRVTRETELLEERPDATSEP